MNLFAQAPVQQPTPQFIISSQAEYISAVESIEVLASTLQNAHTSFPELAYIHIYNVDGFLMGFHVTGVPQAAQADKIAACLMKLEQFGAAISNMDIAFLPPSDDSKLSSRVSKKRASQSGAPVEETTAYSPSTTSTELLASRK